MQHQCLRRLFLPALREQRLVPVPPPWLPAAWQALPTPLPVSGTFMRFIGSCSLHHTVTAPLASSRSMCTSQGMKVEGRWCWGLQGGGARVLLGNKGDICHQVLLQHGSAGPVTARLGVSLVCPHQLNSTPPLIQGPARPTRAGLMTCCL